MMRKIPQLERFPVLQDEFRAGSSDSPRISTRVGPGRAEPERTLTKLWTAWHWDQVRQGSLTTAGGQGRHAFSQRDEQIESWEKEQWQISVKIKFWNSFFIKNKFLFTQKYGCCMLNYIRITNAVSSHSCSTYRDHPMEAASWGDRIANRSGPSKLTSTTLLVRSLNTAESLMTNWVIVQSIISFLHPSRAERATAGVNSLIGETRSLRRTIRENSGINWVWLRELFNGTQLFFAWHNWRSDGASGLVGGVLVGASVLWVCLSDSQTDQGGK